MQRFVFKVILKRYINLFYMITHELYLRNTYFYAQQTSLHRNILHIIIRRIKRLPAASQLINKARRQRSKYMVQIGYHVVIQPGCLRVYVSLNECTFYLASFSVFLSLTRMKTIILFHGYLLADIMLYRIICGILLCKI